MREALRKEGDTKAIVEVELAEHVAHDDREGAVDIASRQRH